MGLLGACKGLWARFGPQFVRFFIVGIGATLVHWCIYVGLNWYFGITQQDTWAYMATFSLGYVISLVANYVVSLRWTFKTTGSGKKGAGFVFSHIINWGLQTGLLRLLLLLGVGAWMHDVAASILPQLEAAYPRLLDPTTLALFPVFCVVVPANFLLVRYFLTRGDAPKASEA